MRLSLSARLSLMVGTVLAIALLAFAGFWLAQLRTERQIAEGTAELLTERARDHLAQRADQTLGYLQQALVNPLIYVDLLAISELIAPFKGQTDVIRVEVYDAERRLMHDGTNDLADFGRILEEAMLPDEGRVLQWTDSALIASGRIDFGNRTIGGVRLSYALTPIEAEAVLALKDVDSRLAVLHRRQALALLGLGALVLALAVVSAWLVSRALLQPIQQLARYAQRVEAGEYPDVPASDRQDELGVLLRRFAAMTEALREHESQIRREALEDPLTGLANRRRLRSHLAEALPTLQAASGQGVLLFLDLDRFKPINDAHGHAMGDRLLQQVATLLRQLAAQLPLGRQELLARLGGDEFLLWLEGKDAALRAERLAEALQPRLAELGQALPQAVALGASIGMAQFPEHGRSIMELLRAADRAMYRAKRAGGGRVAVYDPEQDRDEKPDPELRLGDGEW